MLEVRDLFKTNEKGWNTQLVQEMFKPNTTSDDNILCNISVDGAWKNVKKKSYALAATGWVVEHHGNILNEGGGKVQAQPKPMSY